MARTAYLFELFTVRDKDSFKIFTKNLNEKQNKYDHSAVSNAFQTWMNYTVQMRKIQVEEEQRQKVIEVLKNSNRGGRSTMEKEILRRFIVANLTCIPKSISFSEMDQLCNELDWFPLVGRSILFLQGDFGNVYYMIARGSVGLYLEPSKDREMTIAREFGSLRGQPFLGNDEELKKLGNNIFNLPKGAGFGEYAILASTNKIRSCAAVAIDPNSILFIMHADTYNAVLRQHHYRQKQLSSATALLSELPLFKHHIYSKIASIAYTMKSQTYSSQSIIAKHGDIINNVLLVASGQVKVYAPTSKETDNPTQPGINKIIERRIPKLAVALLGRGQIIGEIEVQKGLRTFQMTYESSAASTEILEMPATVFKESLSTGDFRQSIIYQALDGINQEKEQRRIGRLSRAHDAMKKMMEGNTEDLKAKEELLGILPSIIDPSAALDPTGSMNPTSKNRRTSWIANGSYESPNAPKVTRKISFAAHSSDLTPTKPGTSDKLDQIRTAVSAVSDAFKGSNGHLNSTPPTNIKRSFQGSPNPRKLSFISKPIS